MTGGEVHYPAAAPLSGVYTPPHFACYTLTTLCGHPARFMSDNPGVVTCPDCLRHLRKKEKS